MFNSNAQLLSSNLISNFAGNGSTPAVNLPPAPIFG